MEALDVTGPLVHGHVLQSPDYAEVAYFKQRRGINASKSLGLIRAIIME